MCGGMKTNLLVCMVNRIKGMRSARDAGCTQFCAGLTHLHSCRWLKRVLTFCLIVILVSLVVHILADVGDFASDTLSVVDLHSNFIASFLFGLAGLMLLEMTILRINIRSTCWISPPIAPPPIRHPF
jgi:hypothetical protein